MYGDLPTVYVGSCCCHVTKYDGLLWFYTDSYMLRKWHTRVDSESFSCFWFKKPTASDCLWPTIVTLTSVLLKSILSTELVKLCHSASVAVRAVRTVERAECLHSFTWSCIMWATVVCRLITVIITFIIRWWSCNITSWRQRCFYNEPTKSTECSQHWHDTTDDCAVKGWFYLLLFIFHYLLDCLLLVCIHYLFVAVISISLWVRL